MNWYLTVLKKYVVFSGRARRKEYWMYMLFNTLVQIVLMGIMFATSTPPDEMGRGGSLGLGGMLMGIYLLANFLPSLAVTVRRLHDTNRSGWWVLITLIPYIGGIILLILLCLKGTEGDNRFGEDPLEAEEY